MSPRGMSQKFRVFYGALFSTRCLLAGSASIKIGFRSSGRLAEYPYEFTINLKKVMLLI
jgi:hypothetical protein